MQTFSRMDKHLMAQMNKKNVIQCIDRFGPINRSAIAKMVGLSIPAVMDITEELIAHGLVTSAMREGSGQGKRPEVLSLSGDRFRLVGVDVGRTTTRLVLVGLDKRILRSQKFPTEPVAQPRQYAERVAQAVEQLIEQAGIDPATVLGVCVAKPGLIEPETGRVIFSPNFGWQDVPLKAWMSELLPYPVMVENANRAQGLWEVCVHPDDERLTVLCVGLGYGIGGALIEQGKVYRGASGTSGEIGHVTVSKDSGALCSCGNTGCLESLASGAALAQQARTIVAGHVKTILRDMAGEAPEKIDAKMVFDAAALGDHAARLLIDRAAEYIGIALAMTINLLDPDKIYLCGGLMKNGPYFLTKIKDCTLRRQMHQAGRNVSIQTGSAEEWNVALGATQVIPFYDWDGPALAFMR